VTVDQIRPIRTPGSEIICQTSRDLRRQVQAGKTLMFFDDIERTAFERIIAFSADQGQAHMDSFVLPEEFQRLANEIRVETAAQPPVGGDDNEIDTAFLLPDGKKRMRHSSAAGSSNMMQKLFESLYVRTRLNRSVLGTTMRSPGNRTMFWL